MLQLTQTETFATQKNSLKPALNMASQKLTNNYGVIRPEHIDVEILDLKKYARTKSGASPFLLDAITLFETNGGRISLFDLSTLTSNGSDVPPYIPFIPGMSKFGALSGTQQPTPAIFMNMYRMGTWNIDDTAYDGLFALTDLQACLETGYIAYKMIIEKEADDILGNSLVTEYLTKIYTKMFYDALIKVPGNLPIVEEFRKDAAKFIIAKFFLIYILQKPENDPTVDKYAQIASGSVSSPVSLKAYEENLGINYEKLSLFLASFGVAFFNGNPTSISEFERAWMFMYGEGLALAVEYVPYLLHFLFALSYNSRLGGVSKLENRIQALQKEGLFKLRNAVISVIKR